MDPDDRQAVFTISGGLILATLGLVVLTLVLHFKFVLGIGD